MGLLSSIGKVVGIGTSLLGMRGDQDSDKEAGVMNAQLQKEFAKNGIRWKVADAKAAGVSPLYALGAPVMSASPSFVGGSGPDYAGMGQNIARAIDTGRTKDERVEARLEALQLERGQLENDLLRSQIAQINQPGTGPGLPGSSDLISGQGDVQVTPSKVITGSPESGKRQPGYITEYQFTSPGKDGQGSTIVPSDDMKQRIEDDFFGEMLWHLKNRLIAPRHPDPDMYWNPFMQEYRRNPIPRRYRFIPG